VTELESAVLRVRDYPGVAPAAVLSPGKEVGTTDLTLRVSEWPVDFGMTADNYGSTFNGRYRARAWSAWNNPLGHADRLYVDVLQAFDPEENTYGSVSYITGLGHPMLSGGIEYSVSAFDIDEDIRATYAGAAINGEAQILSVPITAQLIRTRDLSLGVTFAYSHKESSFDDLASDGGAFNREDKEDVLGLAMDVQYVDRWFGSALGVNSIRLGFDYGDLEGDDGPPAAGEPCETTRQGGDGNCIAGTFSKGTIEVSRLQQLFRANSLLFRGFYQYSDDALTSLEQLTLGGFYSIRAYPTSQELFDEGGFASIEWHVDIHNLLETRPQNWDLTAFVSGDYGTGNNNERLEGEPSSVDMAGWGGGMQFQYRFGTRWALEARLDVATPEDDYDEPLPPDDDDDPRYWGWLSLSYR
jgi:hemolysin activation/secretion protein